LSGPKSRSSRVPAGRLERLLRLGVMAGGFAAGGMKEGARRILGGEGPSVNPFLTAQNAEQLARRLASMRGAAMKLGQLLSMQGADVVPPEFAAALALLRDAADTMPEKQVKAVLGREYGRGWEKRFARLDLAPIAAASIGQVHVARTADGRELALKIQYPGVSKSIDSDLAGLHAMLRMSHVLPVDVDVRGILGEAAAQLHREADYLLEADNLERYAELVHHAEPACRVPLVHRDYTTHRILAMDRVHARPLDDVMSGNVPQELRDRVGTLLLRLLMRELFDFRFVQTDPNIGNYQVDVEERLVLLDLGGAREYAPELPENARQLLGAGLKKDDAGVRRALVDMGFLATDDPEGMIRAGVAITLMVAEPMHAAGAYDYGASDLSKRVNRALTELVLKKGYTRAPPPETLFLLRKFGGMYLLLHRIKARVDVGRVVAPFLKARR
jgi:predicted unusual protein kinase regulating ubiquinone biosynthesis (AarF/ABC1/UbiB family)